MNRVSASVRKADKLPTHFLALRLQCPALWEHVLLLMLINEQVRKIQKTLAEINPDYERLIVDEHRLHLTLGVITINNEEDACALEYSCFVVYTNRNGLQQIQDIVASTFDNTRPRQDLSKYPCQLSVQGLKNLRHKVLYLGIKDDENL